MFLLKVIGLFLFAAIGTLSRTLVAQAIDAVQFLKTKAVASRWVIDILICFLFGIFIHFFTKNGMSPDIKTMILIGFIVSFTAIPSHQTFRKAFLNSLFHHGVGMAAAWGGIMLGNYFI
jgi:fluoride ion exporter CrcB/FEX